MSFALRLCALCRPVDDRLVREDVGAVQDLRGDEMISWAFSKERGGEGRTLRILGKVDMTFVFSYAQIWIVLLRSNSKSVRLSPRARRNQTHINATSVAGFWQNTSKIGAIPCTHHGSSATTREARRAGDNARQSP